MKSVQSVTQRRMMSWITLVIFLLFSVMPSPGYAAVVQTVGEDGRLIYTTDSDTVWEVGNFDQAAGTVWDFNLSQGNLLVNVNGGSATTWGGTTNIFGGLLGLFNPHGIHFTDSSRINLTNASFIGAAMNAVNGMNFDTLNLQGGGYLLNEGVMSGGDVTLLGRAVENRGTIEAPLNRITLAAGEAMTVGLSGDNLVSVLVPVDGTVQDFEGNDIEDQIKNSGTMTGNKITLNAKGVDQVFEKAINLKGEIKAVDIDINHKGELVVMSMDDVYNEAILEASKMMIETEGAFTNAGTMDASEGSIEIDAGGDIENSGIIDAKLFKEHGYTFRSTGTIKGGDAYYDNVDGAAFISGDIGSNQTDTGNLIVNGDITLLANDLTFTADSNNDGVGIFHMASGYTVYGNGYGLTLKTGSTAAATPGEEAVLGQGPRLGSFSNMGRLTLDRSTGTPTYTSDPLTTTWDIDDFRIANGAKLNRFSRIMYSAYAPNGSIYQTYDEDVYVVHDVYGLQAMKDFTDGEFHLNNDIDASATATWNSGSGFIPVGNSLNPFTGTFDGHNYKVKDLNINTTSSQNQQYVGLFGYTSGASLDNVGVTDVSISARYGNSSCFPCYASELDTFVGGLVGYNFNTNINNAYVTGSVQGVQNSVHQLSYPNNRPVINIYVGGLVGHNSGDTAKSIANSYSTAHVAATTLGMDANATAGGLVGRSYDAGVFSPIDIINSYSTGDVQAVAEGWNAQSYAGGLVGSIGGSQYPSKARIIDSFATGNASGDVAGGLLATGAGQNGLVTNSYYVDDSHGPQSGKGSLTTAIALQNQNHAVYANWDFDYDGSGAGVTGSWMMVDGVAHLQAEWTTNITNLIELQMMVLDNSADYVLMNDIDAADTATWNPDGSGGYYGFLPIRYDMDSYAEMSFDGNHHEISNLYINRPNEDMVGLFGALDMDDRGEYQIHDLNLTNVDITGGNMTGGLVGYAYGFNWSYYMGMGGVVDIDNVTVSGQVTGGGSGGFISGYGAPSALSSYYGSTGGLVGFAFGDVFISDAHSAVDVTGQGDVGGLIGHFQHWGWLTDSTATGTVHGEFNVGGLIGVMKDGAYVSRVTVTGNDTNFATIDVQGQNSVGGLIGYVGAEQDGYWLHTFISDASVVNVDVDGQDNVGGLIGTANSVAVLSSSVQGGSVKGVTNVGGFIGSDNGFSYYFNNTLATADNTILAIGSRVQRDLIRPVGLVGGVSSTEEIEQISLEEFQRLNETNSGTRHEEIKRAFSYLTSMVKGDSFNMGQFFSILIQSLRGTVQVHQLNQGIHNFEISPDQLGIDAGIEDFRKALFSSESQPLENRGSLNLEQATGASFVNISGDVKVIAQDGAVYAAQEGMALQKGDQIWTGDGARVDVATDGGKNIVKVEEKSAVSLDKEASTDTVQSAKDLLAIAFGKVSVAISDDTSSKFVVQAPNVISGVRS